MLETKEIYPGGSPPKKKNLWKKIENKMEQVRADVFKEKPFNWFSMLWWGWCSYVLLL